MSENHVATGQLGAHRVVSIHASPDLVPSKEKKTETPISRPLCHFAGYDSCEFSRRKRGFDRGGDKRRFAWFPFAARRTPRSNDEEEKGGARTGGIEYSRFLVKDRLANLRGGKRDGIPVGIGRRSETWRYNVNGKNAIDRGTP